MNLIKEVLIMGLTAIDIINLVAAISSIVLAILAIWLSVAFFKSSTTSEKNTEIAINKIGEATDTLSRLSMRLIGKLTNALTVPKPQPDSTMELYKDAKADGVLAGDKSTDPRTIDEVEQYRIDNIIAAMYYSGLSNMALQVQLPPTIGETANLGQANLVDQSRADYFTLKGWLSISSESDKKIGQSPVKHLYDSITELESNIHTVREYYTLLDQPVESKDKQ